MARHASLVNPVTAASAITVFLVMANVSVPKASRLSRGASSVKRIFTDHPALHAAHAITTVAVMILLLVMVDAFVTKGTLLKADVPYVMMAGISIR